MHAGISFCFKQCLEYALCSEHSGKHFTWYYFIFLKQPYELDTIIFYTLKMKEDLKSHV